MHVIMGGRGAVGQAVCNTLEAQGRAFAAPSSREADARDADALSRACEGADAIINCIGLPYTAKAWRRGWPKVAQACATAAERTGARLVFLDNIYMYGPAPLEVPITEDHPQSPPSRKGKTRKVVADTLLEAHAAGRAQVVIGRSADFYGPGAPNSLLYASFLERMVAGKPPLLLMTPTARHTFSYAPDIARPLIRLADDPGAAGRAWHLPVGPAAALETWVDRFNGLLGTDFSATYLPPLASAVLGWLSPIVREAHEMRYQFDSDYVVSDTDFRERYPDFEVTSYDDGAAATLDWAKAEARGRAR